MRCFLRLSALVFWCTLLSPVVLFSQNVQKLFNGKDLSGWHTIPGGQWEVSKGAIHGTAGKSDTRHGLLVTDDVYEDFVLSVDYKALKGNSGLYFRIEEVGGTVGVAGLQAEIDPTRDAGGLYETEGRGWVSQPKPEDVKRWYKPNAWNHMEVRAVGGDVTVTVNGQVSAQITNDPGRRFGHIALQLHGSVDMDVWFKNIELRPIPVELAEPHYTAHWSSLDRRPTPQWWLDAKFGIFIHWGMYSVPGFSAKGSYAEWYQNALTNNSYNGKIQAFHKTNYGERTYYDLADDFHAELYNPDEWAELFEKAGAKYVVLTSKHHDGFCLWPDNKSAETWGFPWNASVRGPKRDLMGDLFKALRKTSVKPGFYYSLYEWYNPLWKKDRAKYATEHMIPQLRDAIEKYDPWVVWGDGEWDAPSSLWKSRELLAWLYNESKVRDFVVPNDRWGSDVRFKHGGTYTPEYQPDLEFEDHAWEESRGMGLSYGYNRLEDAWDYNSAQTLVLHLIDKVARGGNFLLDIGPDAHGKIPPIMQERLLDMGRWLKVNGEAIYGSRRWRETCQWSEGRRDFKPQLVEGWKTDGDALLDQTLNPPPGYAAKEAFFTWNPDQDALYVILPKYPDNRKFTLKSLVVPPTSKVFFLPTREVLKTEVVGNNTIVHFPEFDPNKIKETEAFALKIVNFGAFAAKPQIKVDYDPATMRPTVTLSGASPNAQLRYTLDGSDPDGNAPLYERPFSPEKTCTLRVRAFAPGLLASGERTQTVTLYPLKRGLAFAKKPAPGLRLSYLSLPKQFSLQGLAESGTEKTVIAAQIEADTHCLKYPCAMRWDGHIQVQETGGYRFSTASNDGSILWVDGEKVVDNDGNHGREEKSGMIQLEKGWHRFQLFYFNSSGNGSLEVQYGRVGKALQPIPATSLGQ